MRILILVSIIFLTGFSDPKTPLRPPVKIPDAEITNFLVGSWVVPPDDADRTDKGSISIYKADGNFVFAEFETNDCKVPINIIYGRWMVENGRFILFYLKDFQGIPLQADYKITDRVLAINDNEKTLQSEEDRKVFRRVKSNTCIK